MAVRELECDPVEQLLQEIDENCMPIPDLESDPHLLISKVRKHYMEYMVKLLSINYETHQKLVNKNIYLPSAIWRCAKNIEMTAAKACMVVQLYRKNMISVVKELKNDTIKGKLHKKLYSCLNKPPENDKKTQTSMKDNNCQCIHNKRKRRHRASVSPQHPQREYTTEFIKENLNTYSEHAHAAPHTNITSVLPSASDTKDIVMPNIFPPAHVQPDLNTVNQNYIKPFSPLPTRQLSVESQDSDELMMQLEKLFQGDATDDDLFEGALYDKLDTSVDNQSKQKIEIHDINILHAKQDSVIENHAAQIKSLDERLASLAGLINNDNIQQKPTEPEHHNKSRRSGSSKWLCEEYYLRQKLHELLDQIGDNNRKELEKLKEKFLNLFGIDSDDEGVLSPLNETPEFVISCKERIAPWVVKLLTPYYIKGHIKGKGIFKALAKHLIRLIYQCSRYPAQYEVTSFVTDFLKNHRTIRCEADFKEFRIDNI